MFTLKQEVKNFLHRDVDRDVRETLTWTVLEDTLLDGAPYLKTAKHFGRWATADLRAQDAVVRKVEDFEFWKIRAI